MFGVPKYSAALEKLRVERKVEGLFSHNLVSIDNAKREATFATADGGKVVESFDLLHVVPPQGPMDFIKGSPIGSSSSPSRRERKSSPRILAADAAGWVAVDPATTQHVKFGNIFSLGDASSLPNSKTAAAISAQAPVLVDNLRAHMDGKPLQGVYSAFLSRLFFCGRSLTTLSQRDTRVGEFDVVRERRIGN